jgi:serine/threonine-protein kinase
VRVYDIGRTAETIYLTMELVEGETLKARLNAGVLSIEDAQTIAKQILEALEELHRLGIVHRDVKPSNVLLGRDGTVKLADFGLAFRVDGSGTRVTRTDGLVGTVEYLSPEQALGERVDPRSDLYSVGVVLYEMLAGRLPHERESSLGTLLARLGERPPDVRLLRPETPPWLARAVSRLLERRRADRYANATAALSDLESQRVGPRGHAMRTCHADMGDCRSRGVSSLGSLALSGRRPRGTR